MGKQSWHVVRAGKTDATFNEITAIPDLLQMFELKGCIITIDAMGCQTDIAAEIIGKKAESDKFREDIVFALLSLQIGKLSQAKQPGKLLLTPKPSLPLSPLFSKTVQSAWN